MIVLYNELHKLHDPTIPPGYPEKPYRIESIISEIKRSEIANLIKINGELDPKNAHQVHTDQYLDFLKSYKGNGNEYHVPLQTNRFIHDISSPLCSHTYVDALRSAFLAYEGAQRLLTSDDIIYALCRPPGHHATRSQMGGFCYINNAAVAAQFLSKHGNVAILDIDFHHGNGTQDIFYEREDVLYVSIHEDPRIQYPYDAGFTEEIGRGKGKGYNHNIPLSPGKDNATYESALHEAFKYITNYKPASLIVSVGYDTYEDDLLGDFHLSTSYYQTIGKQISDLGIPTLLVQEGGYHEDIGKNAVSFIKGFSNNPTK